MKSQVIENLPVLKERLKASDVSLLDIKKALVGKMSSSTVERGLCGLMIEEGNARLIMKTCEKMIAKSQKQAA